VLETYFLKTAVLCYMPMFFIVLTYFYKILLKNKNNCTYINAYVITNTIHEMFYLLYASI